MLQDLVKHRVYSDCVCDILYLVFCKNIFGPRHQDNTVVNGFWCSVIQSNLGLTTKTGLLVYYFLYCIALNPIKLGHCKALIKQNVVVC